MGCDGAKWRLRSPAALGRRDPTPGRRRVAGHRRPDALAPR
jgi:hypothetical protein